MKPNPVIGAIDIGTNSAHMVVAEIKSNGQMTILDKYKAVLRLGDAIEEKSKRLAREAIMRTVTALKQMKEIASGYQPLYRVVATHAVRSAVNREAFIDIIFRETGITVDLIDGLEEARLVALGMQYGLPLKEKIFLGVDIGGGSTELVVCRGSVVHYASSLHLGSVILTKNWLDPKKVKRGDVAQLEQHIQQIVSPLVPTLKDLKFDCAVASSGVAKALAGMQLQARNNRSFDPNGVILSSGSVERMYERLKSLRHPAKIQEEWGIDQNRSEIILAGTAILVALAKVMKVSAWTVSTYGLREGLVADTYSRLETDSGMPSQGNDIRWQSIVDLGTKFKIDTRQAETVTRLSLELYTSLLAYNPALAGNHGTELSDHDLLRAAAWLHECGKFISFPRYHHHSQYLISHSLIMGYSQKERRLIALINRFHRKGRASIESPSCHDLCREEVERINLLAGALRIAVAANRTRAGAVGSLRLKVRPTGLVLAVRQEKNQLPEVDFRKIIREKSVLERMLGRPIGVALG